MGSYDFSSGGDSFKTDEYDFTPGGRPPRSPLPFILGGAAVLLLAALIAFSAVRASLDNKAYQAAHVAYLSGDCASALPAFEKLTHAFRLFDFGGRIRSARLERAECVPYQQAVEVENSANPAAALLAWQGFITANPASGLLEAALQRVDDLFARSAPIELASPESCAALKDMLAHDVIPNLDQNLPTLLYGCGLLAEQNQDYTSAEYYYETALSNNAAHPLASQIQGSLVSLVVNQARAANAPELPPPSPSGTTVAGSTVVVIQNDSPDALRIYFSGPQPLIQELPACPDCVDFASEPPACPAKGPIGTYTLSPGSYDVVVESISSEGVEPFRGTWQLEDGIEFYSCFFIITTPAP